MKAFIGVSGTGHIVVYIGDSRQIEFPISQEGCRMVAEFLAGSGIFDWGYSSSVDHVDEYEEVFSRNVGDAIEEEMSKICV